MNRCEQLVEQAERHLRARQVATYWKIPNDLRLTKDSELVYGDRGPCDFIGHTVRGRAILLEAKMTARSTLQVPHKRGIKGHQWIALRDADAAGCVSAIVWLHREEIAVLPFRRAAALLNGRKSLPWRGGASLEVDEPSLVVADLLIDTIDLGAELAHLR